MANNADEIVFARPQASGVFFSAPISTTPPTTAAAALTGFNNLGYVSDAGIVQTIDRTNTILKDMGASNVKVLEQSKDVHYTLTPLQLSQYLLEEMLGTDNVTLDNGVVSAAVLNENPLPDRVYVFDMLLSDMRKMRVVIPRGHVTATGDMTFNAGVVTNSELTIEALKDTAGNKAYYYYAE